MVSFKRWIFYLISLTAHFVLAVYLFADPASQLQTPSLVEAQLSPISTTTETFSNSPSVSSGSTPSVTSQASADDSTNSTSSAQPSVSVEKPTSSTVPANTTQPSAPFTDSVKGFNTKHQTLNNGTAPLAQTPNEANATTTGNSLSSKQQTAAQPTTHLAKGLTAKNTVNAKCSSQAKAQGLKGGTFKIHVWVNSQGKVTRANVVTPSSSSLMNQTLEQLAMGVTFNPATNDAGQAIAAETTITAHHANCSN